MKLKFLAIALVATTVLMSCNSKNKSENAENPNAKSGVITEVIHTSQYTYLSLDNEGTQFWVAVPSMESATVGKKVSFEDGMEMFNFESKELKRTFEFIYFSQGVLVEGEESNEIKAAHGNMGQNNATATGEREAITVTYADGAVKLVDLFAKRNDFSGKTVKVTGKVVKVNVEIMGKNWIHIQDGTGETANVDLTVTTADVPEMGQVVTFEGKLNLNKDFGSGYSYEVIMEDAKLVMAKKI